MTDKVQKPGSEWKKELTPEQYKIAREKGTERAFTGKYWNNHAEGMYKCVCCGAPLFQSDTKYDSGSGWPSFYQPVAAENVREETDGSLMMRAPKSSARRAMRTWAMFFRTARSRPGCATASIRRR